MYARMIMLTMGGGEFKTVTLVAMLYVQLNGRNNLGDSPTIYNKNTTNVCREHRTRQIPTRRVGNEDPCATP